MLQVAAQILINEYTGANYDTHTDNYGEYVARTSSPSTTVPWVPYVLHIV